MRVIPKNFRGAVIEQRCLKGETFKGVTVYGNGKPLWFYVPKREQECKPLWKALKTSEGSVNFGLKHVFDLKTGEDVNPYATVCTDVVTSRYAAATLRAAATILRHNGDQATARRVMTMALKLEASK